MNAEIAQLAEVGAEFYGRGWMLATGGNLSASDGSTGAMTASGGHKGRLGPDDFLEWTIGSPLPTIPKPSAEAAVHVALYEHLPKTRAILHVHSPFVTLVSRKYAGAGAVQFEGFEFIKALGFWQEGAVVEMPIVPNHHDIPMLASAVQAAVGEVPGVLVEGHGLYAWGESIAAAQRHIEATEFLCQMVWEWDRAHF